MTALSIVQDACGRMGLQQPSALFSSLSPQDIQFRTLLNQEGKELYKRKPWTNLQREQTFTTVATAAQTSSVASDFGYYVNDTMFDRTENRKLVGPLNEYEWQREKSGPAFTSVYHAFRFWQGSVYITPTPEAGNTVAYEYITKNWAITASDSSAKAAFSVDTDTSHLDEELLTLGLIWRFRKAKGLDYSEEFRTYQMEVDNLAGKDGGAPVLNLSSGLIKRRFYNGNIKEGSWP